MLTVNIPEGETAVKKYLFDRSGLFEYVPFCDKKLKKKLEHMVEYISTIAYTGEKSDIPDNTIKGNYYLISCDDIDYDVEYDHKITLYNQDNSKIIGEKLFDIINMNTQTNQFTHVTYSGYNYNKIPVFICNIYTTQMYH